MVQIIQENRRPSFGERLSGGVERGLDIGSKLMEEQRQLNLLKSRGESISKLTGMDAKGLSEKQQETLLSEFLKGSQKQNLLKQKQEMLKDMFGGGAQREQSELMQQQDESMQQQMPSSQSEQGFNPISMSDQQIAQITAMDPNIGKAIQHAKDVALREQREEKGLKRKEFESERSYHTQFSKESEKEVEAIRNSLPKVEMALDYARNAVETGNMTFFSPDKLADITGVDLFRTAKGAQLVTAGKENLLGNMSRVSARAQNQWLEQRMNSMFPKIGQSKEANLTVQEMLEGEAALNNAYLQEFDRLSEQDIKEYGFVRKDINKRARDATKFKEKEIVKRSSYRMKEIEEVEKGLSKLKKEVGKNVPKHTPLTLAMAKLYKEKFGENALKVAEKNGYYIPSLEEFSTFRDKSSQNMEE